MLSSYSKFILLVLKFLPRLLYQFPIHLSHKITTHVPLLSITVLCCHLQQNCDYVLNHTHEITK